VTNASDALPRDLAAAHAMILAERAARLEAEAAEARERAANSSTDALIRRLKLEIEKLMPELYGTRSERKARPLDPLEMQLEDLEADATEDELAGEIAARATSVVAFQRKRPARQPFPDHLPRERVVVVAPESCPCCGSLKLVKLGEDITETLEVIPRQWKVIQTVRERFSCRKCETIAQPPAPFHVIPRGHAGPNLLAMVLFEKYGQHSENYKAAIAASAVPTFVKNLGIEFMDDAVACRLSIGDIARENFGKPTAHKRSRELFDDTSVVWAQDMIEKQITIWLPAFMDALKRRENGNG